MALPDFELAPGTELIQYVQMIKTAAAEIATFLVDSKKNKVVTYHPQSGWEKSMDYKIQVNKCQKWPHGLNAEWSLGTALQKQHRNECIAPHLSPNK